MRESAFSLWLHRDIKLFMLETRKIREIQERPHLNTNERFYIKLMLQLNTINLNYCLCQFYKTNSQHTYLMPYKRKQYEKLTHNHKFNNNQD